MGHMHQSLFFCFFFHIIYMSYLTHAIKIIINHVAINHCSDSKQKNIKNELRIQYKRVALRALLYFYGPFFRALFMTKIHTTVIR